MSSISNVGERTGFQTSERITQTSLADKRACEELVQYTHVKYPAAPTYAYMQFLGPIIMEEEVYNIRAFGSTSIVTLV